jgi:hypothetical protein
MGLTPKEIKDLVDFNKMKKDHLLSFPQGELPPNLKELLELTGKTYREHFVNTREQGYFQSRFGFSKSEDELLQLNNTTLVEAI